MKFYANLKAYTWWVLLPLWLSVYIVIFSLFGLVLTDPYFITLVFLIVLSLLLLIRASRDNGFYLDMKKGMFLKGDKNIPIRDIDVVEVYKKGSLAKINLKFEYGSNYVLTNTFDANDLNRLYNFMKKYNKRYRVDNKKLKNRFILPVLLGAIYGVIYMSVSYVDIVEFSMPRQNVRSKAHDYNEYRFRLPAEFLERKSVDMHNVYIEDKGERIIVVDTIDSPVDKGIFGALGISSNLDILKHISQNKYSLLYTFLVNRTNTEEFSQKDYESITTANFYNHSGDSLIFVVDHLNNDKLLVFYLKNFSKDEFFEASDTLARNMIINSES